MKRFVALTLMLVAVLVAGVALAQQPDDLNFLDSALTRGKTYQMSGAAAVDTIHSTQTKASTVAATKWRGPIPIYTASGTGAWKVSGYSMPNAWYMYARKPFYFKALFPNGDSTGVYSTNVDTTSTTTATQAVLSGFDDVYPCRYLLMAPVSQLRIDSTASDTLYVVPYVLKH